MKAAAVVAYGCEGDLYCPEHIQFEHADIETGHVWPVFECQEGWRNHSCPTCLNRAIETGAELQTLGDVYGYKQTERP